MQRNNGFSVSERAQWAQNRKTRSWQHSGQKHQWAMSKHYRIDLGDFPQLRDLLELVMKPVESELCLVNQDIEMNNVHVRHQDTEINSVHDTHQDTEMNSVHATETQKWIAYMPQKQTEESELSGGSRCRNHHQIKHLLWQQTCWSPPLNSRPVTLQDYGLFICQWH